mmetsp:Transcript_49399/g.117375  ORF Transcript_49399/g.117375 Transcript_49399/m.117375 type:complete len:771 (+) Transcript_49399:29-2341(+)
MSEGPVFVASPLQPASNESQKANFNMPNSRSPKSGPAHDYPVDDPAMCGVGVYFERLEMDMAKPQIKEITPRGSAHRDGTLEVGDFITHIEGVSCAGWSLGQLRQAILGIAGTMVRLTMNKGNGRILEVALPRGNPEYWTQVDAAENLRKDLKVRDKEIEALRRKLRESESAMQRDRTEVDNLNVQVGSLERLSQKLQMDLEREVDQRRRAESSVASLSADKNSLEDQMEAVVKKMSESALSFKSAQGLAREMTEKARQSEQGRVMEEKLRKMAEAREAKSQALLLDEVQRRKEAEAERTLSEARYVEVSESVRHMENLNRDLAKAKAEVIDLQGQIAIAHSEIESKKEFVAKVQTENGEVRSQSGDVEVRILTIRKELRDALDRVKLADEALRGAELAKEDCMQREGENIKLLSATDGKLRGTTMRLADAEAVATALRGELQKLQAQLAETVSEKGKEVLNAADFEKALAMLKDKMESLNIKKKSEGQSADARDASLRAEVAELHKSMAARDQNLAEITTQLSTTSRELSAKVAAGEGAILMKEDKVTALTHSLAASQTDLKNTKRLLAEHEKKRGRNDGPLRGDQERAACGELRDRRAEVRELAAGRGDAGGAQGLQRADGAGAARTAGQGGAGAHRERPHQALRRAAGGAPRVPEQAAPRRGPARDLGGPARQPRGEAQGRGGVQGRAQRLDGLQARGGSHERYVSDGEQAASGRGAPPARRARCGQDLAPRRRGLAVHGQDGAARQVLQGRARAAGGHLRYHQRAG